jgi:3',5'-cyclic AMP phosphodiesterase CpdA
VQTGIHFGYNAAGNVALCAEGKGMADGETISTMAFRLPNVDQLMQATGVRPLVRFVHFSDTHISADPNYTHAEADYTPLEGAREVVRQINALPFEPEFVLHSGDVIFDPDDASYEVARELLSEIRFPLHYLMGNHDERTGFQRILLGMEQTTPKHFYEFDINGVQFLALDSNAPAPFAGGSLGDAQLAWLRERCTAQDPRPLVVMVHHNALPIDAPFWDSFMRMTDGEAFHRTLGHAVSRLRGVFFGHVHQGTETLRDGILYVSAPSTWYQLHCYPGQSGILQDVGAEPGFNVVTITAQQTFIRRHRFSVAEQRR